VLRVCGSTAGGTVGEAKCESQIVRNAAIMCSGSSVIDVTTGVILVGLLLQVLMVLLLRVSRWRLSNWVWSFIRLSYVHVLVAAIRVVMLGSTVRGLLSKNVGGWFSM
jgi:hypothetical protein